SRVVHSSSTTHCGESNTTPTSTTRSLAANPVVSKSRTAKPATSTPPIRGDRVFRRIDASFGGGRVFADQRPAILMSLTIPVPISSQTVLQATDLSVVVGGPAARVRQHRVRERRGPWNGPVRLIKPDSDVKGVEVHRPTTVPVSPILPRRNPIRISPGPLV